METALTEEEVHAFGSNFDFMVEIPVDDDDDERNEIEGPVKISRSDSNNYILQQKSTSTKRKEITDYNQLKRYLLSIGETRDIENIEKKELDLLLCQFFMNAKSAWGILRAGHVNWIFLLIPSNFGHQKL